MPRRSSCWRRTGRMTATGCRSSRTGSAPNATSTTPSTWPARSCRLRLAMQDMASQGLHPRRAALAARGARQEQGSLAVVSERVHAADSERVRGARDRHRPGDPPADHRARHGRRDRRSTASTAHVDDQAHDRRMPGRRPHRAGRHRGARMASTGYRRRRSSTVTVMTKERARRPHREAARRAAEDAAVRAGFADPHLRDHERQGRRRQVDRDRQPRLSRSPRAGFASGSWMPTCSGSRSPASSGSRAP